MFRRFFHRFRFQSVKLAPSPLVVYSSSDDDSDDIKIEDNNSNLERRKLENPELPDPKRRKLNVLRPSKC